MCYARTLRMSVLLGGLSLVATGWGDEPSLQVVPKPATDTTNSHYVGNRAPLKPTPLIKLPVGAIRPEGWLRRQLQLQAEGFHGHLGEISPYLIKKNNAWLDPTGSGDHGWEEPPYWLKGYCNLGYVMRDEAIQRESQIWIEAALKSQKPDGWFGPDRGRTGEATDLKGRDDLWPNMIMLFALQDYHEFTGDVRVIDLMTRYFRYLEQRPADQLLLGYWPKMRGGDLLMSVYWLYNRTGESWLLGLADKVQQSTADWTRDVIDWHNVNMSQGFGRPTSYYMQSGAGTLAGVVSQLRQDPADVRPGAGRDVRRRRELPSRLHRSAPGRGIVRHGRDDVVHRNAHLDHRRSAVGRSLRRRRIQLVSRGADRRLEGTAIPDRAEHGALRQDGQEP